MSYVYQSFEKGLWTVGFYTPHGNWLAESDHESRESAALRVHYLNGGDAAYEKEYKERERRDDEFCDHPTLYHRDGECTICHKRVGS